MGYFFDENYYLSTKLAQLQSAGERDQDGREYTFASLRKSIVQFSGTVREHYEQHGREEGLNPNQYFNETEYLSAKLRQMRSVGEKDSEGREYTLDSLRAALDQSGLLPVEFYELFGSYETDAAGHFVNPSNAFDVNAYFPARLLQAWLSGENVGGKSGTDVSMGDLLTAMARSCASPVTHYLKYGAQEVEGSGIPLAQPVPMCQRVPDDPWRASTGDTVPPNHGPATPAPETVTSPQAPSASAESRAPAPERLATSTSLALNSVLFFPDASFKLAAHGEWMRENHLIDGPLASEPVASFQTEAFGGGGSTANLGPQAVEAAQESAVRKTVEHGVSSLNRPVNLAADGDLEQPFGFSGLEQDFMPGGGQAWYTAHAGFEAHVPGRMGEVSFSLSGDNVTLRGFADNTHLRIDASGHVLGLPGEAVLGDGGLFDASAVTGDILTIDFSGFKGEYAVKGSLTARNVFTLGALVTRVEGGTMDDLFIIHADHANTATSFVLGGSGSIGDVLELAADAAEDVGIGAVIGQSGDDRLFIKGAHETARLQVESVELGSGVNTLVLEHALLMSPLNSLGGENTVILNEGGVIAEMTFHGPDGSDSIQINSGGIAGDINTGRGDDIVALYAGAQAGFVAMGDGNDLVIITAGAVLAGVDGGEGLDTLRVEGSGATVLEDISNIDVLDLSGDGEAQTVILTDTVVTGENGLSAIRFDRAEDVVVLGGAALNNIAAIENSDTGQGVFCLSDSDSIVLSASSFTNGAIAELRLKGQQSAVMDADTLTKIASITGTDGDNTITIAGNGADEALSVDLSLTAISQVSSLLFDSTIRDILIGQGSLSGSASLFGLSSIGDKVTIQGVDGEAASGKDDVDGSENRKWHLSEDQTELTYWDNSLSDNGAQVTLVREVAAVAAVGLDSLIWECVWSG